jgi:2,4-dichlorophenol 6-monooxygenase
MGDTLFTTSLAGPEIARLRTWGTGEERIGDYLQASPCTMLDLPQTHLEPLLVKHAAARGASLAFNTEYRAHTQDDGGVTTTLRDRLSGREYTVRSRYLVGADGARSRVVEDAGLTITGQHARAGTMYVLFSADLAHLAAHRPSILYWIVTDSASFGEIGQGVLRAIRPWNQWIAGWGFDLAQGEPQLSEAQIIERIRVLVGEPELKIRIDMQSIWYVNQAWAPHYAKGHVFCAGDAVHRHPPSSGLGSNTCLQDAHNLAWKLAYVIKGHAGPGLLDSYSLERAPVGEQVVARANQSRLDYAPLNACFRDPNAAQPVRAGLASLADPGPEGVARRERLAEALRLKHDEFNALGTESNHRYVSGAVIADDAMPEEVWKHDRQLHAQATTRPGAKLPHAWLVGSDGQRPLHPTHRDCRPALGTGSARDGSAIPARARGRRRRRARPLLQLGPITRDRRGGCTAGAARWRRRLASVSRCAGCGRCTGSIARGAAKHPGALSVRREFPGAGAADSLQLRVTSAPPRSARPPRTDAQLSASDSAPAEVLG